MEWGVNATALNVGATHDRGIQEICFAGKCRRSRHWRDHRRRLRRDRQFAGGGYPVTAHRRCDRRLRFLQSLSAAVIEGDRGFAGRSQETRRGPGVGEFPHHHHQLHHHRLGFVPRGQADESGHAVRGAEDTRIDQAGDSAHGDPRPVEARAKMIAPRLDALRVKLDRSARVGATCFWPRSPRKTSHCLPRTPKTSSLSRARRRVLDCDFCLRWIGSAACVRYPTVRAGTSLPEGGRHCGSDAGGGMAAKSDSKVRVIAHNRKARFNYQIGETFEAGLALTGTEVKSLRGGKATIAAAYADSRGGEIWLVNANIPEYLQGGRFNHAPKRVRKLLLHRRQINKLMGAVEREGMTLVPLKLYFNEKGRAKLELALARGKKLHDKRETEKRRSWERERGRLLRAKG